MSAPFNPSSWVSRMEAAGCHVSVFFDRGKSRLHITRPEDGSEDIALSYELAGHAPGEPGNQETRRANTSQVVAFLSGCACCEEARP